MPYTRTDIYDASWLKYVAKEVLETLRDHMEKFESIDENNIWRLEQSFDKHILDEIRFRNNRWDIHRWPGLWSERLGELAADWEQVMDWVLEEIEMKKDEYDTNLKIEKKYNDDEYEIERLEAEIERWDELEEIFQDPEEELVSLQEQISRLKEEQESRNDEFAQREERSQQSAIAAMNSGRPVALERHREDIPMDTTGGEDEIRECWVNAEGVYFDEGLDEEKWETPVDQAVEFLRREYLDPRWNTGLEDQLNYYQGERTWQDVGPARFSTPTFQLYGFETGDLEEIDSRVYDSRVSYRIHFRGAREDHETFDRESTDQIANVSSEFLGGTPETIPLRVSVRGEEVQIYYEEPLSYESLKNVIRMLAIPMDGDDVIRRDGFLFWDFVVVNENTQLQPNYYWLPPDPELIPEEERMGEPWRSERERREQEEEKKKDEETTSAWREEAEDGLFENPRGMYWSEALEKIGSGASYDDVVKTVNNFILVGKGLSSEKKELLVLTLIKNLFLMMKKSNDKIKYFDKDNVVYQTKQLRTVIKELLNSKDIKGKQVAAAFEKVESIIEESFRKKGLSSIRRSSDLRKASRDRYDIALYFDTIHARLGTYGGRVPFDESFIRDMLLIILHHAIDLIFPTSHTRETARIFKDLFYYELTTLFNEDQAYIGEPFYRVLSQKFEDKVLTMIIDTVTSFTEEKSEEVVISQREPFEQWRADTEGDIFENPTRAEEERDVLLFEWQNIYLSPSWNEIEKELEDGKRWAAYHKKHPGFVKKKFQGKTGSKYLRIKELIGLYLLFSNEISREVKRLFLVQNIVDIDFTEVLAKRELHILKVFGVDGVNELEIKVNDLLNVVYDYYDIFTDKEKDLNYDEFIFELNTLSMYFSERQNKLKVRVDEIIEEMEESGKNNDFVSLYREQLMAAGLMLGILTEITHQEFNDLWAFYIWDMYTNGFLFLSQRSDKEIRGDLRGAVIRMRKTVRDFKEQGLLMNPSPYDLRWASPVFQELYNFIVMLDNEIVDSAHLGQIALDAQGFTRETSPSAVKEEPARAYHFLTPIINELQQELIRPVLQTVNHEIRELFGKERPPWEGQEELSPDDLEFKERMESERTLMSSINQDLSKLQRQMEGWGVRTPSPRKEEARITTTGKERRHYGRESFEKHAHQFEQEGMKALGSIQEIAKKAEDKIKESRIVRPSRTFDRITEKEKVMLRQTVDEIYDMMDETPEITLQRRLSEEDRFEDVFEFPDHPYMVISFRYDIEEEEDDEEELEKEEIEKRIAHFLGIEESRVSLVTLDIGVIVTNGKINELAKILDQISSFGSPHGLVTIEPGIIIGGWQLYPSGPKFRSIEYKKWPEWLLKQVEEMYEDIVYYLSFNIEAFDGKNVGTWPHSNEDGSLNKETFLDFWNKKFEGTGVSFQIAGSKNVNILSNRFIVEINAVGQLNPLSGLTKGEVISSQEVLRAHLIEGLNETYSLTTLISIDVYDAALVFGDFEPDQVPIMPKAREQFLKRRAFYVINEILISGPDSPQVVMGTRRNIIFEYPYHGAMQEGRPEVVGRV